MRAVIPGIALALCLPLGAQDNARTSGDRSGIAARINDEIITWDEILSHFKDWKAGQVTEELRRDHLRELAQDRLFKQEARRLKITVTDEEIDDSVKRVAKMAGGEERYEEWRRFMKLTKEQHREQIRKEILELKLYRFLIASSWRGSGSDIPLLVEVISPEEIRAYYEKHRDNYKGVRQAVVWRIGLLFNTDEEKAFKKRLLESLLRKLDKGTDFYLLANYYSEIWITDDKGTRVFGIKDLKPTDDVFKPETMKYLFDVAVVGKSTGIIEDGKSLNIFFLEQRVDRKEETFEEAQIKIRTELEHRKREENRKRLRDEILKRAYIWPEDLFKQRD